MKTFFEGTDANLEISLTEYGFIARHTAVDYQDEHFVVYHIYDNKYGTGYKRESELDSLIKGEDWATVSDIKSFLEFTGNSTAEEWINELSFVHKLSDTLNFWGTSNILGEDYNPISEEEAIKKYITPQELEK